MTRRRPSQLTLLTRLVGLAETVDPPVPNSFAPGDWRREAYKFLLKHMGVYAAATEKLNQGASNDPYLFIAKTRSYYTNCCAATMNLLHQLKHADPTDGSMTVSPRKKKRA